MKRAAPAPAKKSTAPATATKKQAESKLTTAQRAYQRAKLELENAVAEEAVAEFKDLKERTRRSAQQVDALFSTLVASDCRIYAPKDPKSHLFKLCFTELKKPFVYLRYSTFAEFTDRWCAVIDFPDRHDPPGDDFINNYIKLLMITFLRTLHARMVEAELPVIPLLQLEEICKI